MVDDLFKKFPQQNSDFLSGTAKGLSPGRRRTVDSASSPAGSKGLGLKEALLFQSVKHGIKRPRAEFVAVTLQLLDHGEAKNGLLTGVVQDMNADQPGEEFLIGRVSCSG